MVPSDNDPNEVVTELRDNADWNEALLFFTTPYPTMTPRDLTGYSASGALTPRSGTGSAFPVSTAVGTMTIATNTVTILVTHTAKSALKLGVYDFDMVLITPGGVREEVPRWAYEVTHGNAP